jgi:uncharacterized protein (TIGR02246 family)
MDYAIDRFERDVTSALLATGAIPANPVEVITPPPSIEADLTFPAFRAARAAATPPATLAQTLDDAHARAHVLVYWTNPDLPDEERSAVAEAVGVGAEIDNELAQDPKRNITLDWDRMLALDGDSTTYIGLGAATDAVAEMEDIMASTESEVRTLVDRWSEAVRAKDLDRLMGLYAPDIVYFDVVPPLQFIGSAAVRENFVRWFESWESAIGQDIRDMQILASGDTAVAFMLIRASGTLKNGREVGYWVRATIGCRRSPHGWVIAHEHISLPVDVASGRAVIDLVP